MLRPMPIRPATLSRAPRTPPPPLPPTPRTPSKPTCRAKARPRPRPTEPTRLRNTKGRGRRPRPFCLRLRRSGPLEHVDELVGLAPHRRIEHQLGAVVGRIAQDIAFADEPET